ncbi:hypothetical protein DRQ36_07120 [bacterium]|nr:MAG: hypothetical protein DRQ36_07120 [bacterium]
MPFSEIFYHAAMGIDTSENPVHGVTAKLVATKLEDELDNIGCFPVAVGLMPDHAHILFGAPAEASPDAIITALKEATSELVSGMGRDEQLIWKREYGVVSVSRSHLDIVEDYVRTQQERHSSGKVNKTLERME